MAKRKTIVDAAAEAAAPARKSFAQNRITTSARGSSKGLRPSGNLGPGTKDGIGILGPPKKKRSKHRKRRR